MSERIRPPRPVNPVPKPEPVEPAPVPRPVEPAPAPVPESAPARLGSYGNASIDKHDAAILAAVEAVRGKRGVSVDPHFLKGVMDVESGGNGDYPPGRCRPCDGHDCVPACGPFQIKHRYHRQRCPECDFSTVAGQAELAAHIIGMTMAERGIDEYGALTAVYFPTDDANGTSQNAYVKRVRELVRRMEADAAGTTPAPEPTPAPPKPVDPLSAILGRKPVPPVTYGWLDDVGLDYYGYGVGHGTQRSTQHTGIDLSLPCGASLHAPAAGVVDCVGDAGAPRWGQACGAYRDVDGGGAGNVSVLLDPGRVKLTLGHCRDAFVRPGQRVAAGQKVATVGSMNGCHVHVETSIERNGTYWLVEPVAALRSVMGGPLSPRPAPVVYDIQRPADAARFGLDAAEARELLGMRIEDRAGYRPQAIVWHIQDGNSAGSLDWWLRGVVNGRRVRASATVLVQRDGSVLRVIPEQHGPWTNGKVDTPDAWGRALAELGGGDPNRVSLTIEFEGAAGEALTPAQENAGLWQTERWMAAYGIPASNVGGHYQIDSVDRPGCPGAKVMAAKAKLGGSAPAPLIQPVDPLLLALFPGFNPDPKTGPVSAAWTAARVRDKKPYPFLRRHDAPNGDAYFVFAPDLVLVARNGKVEEVAAA